MENQNVQFPLNLRQPIADKAKQTAAVYSSENNSSEGDQMRFSDAELQEFKELILSKLNEAKIDFGLLRGTLSRHNDNGTNDTSPTFKLWEDAEEVFSKEEISQLALRLEKFIINLQNALIRIENKTYGICRVTGKLIAKERLRSVPHATMSMDAKMEMADLN